MTHVFLVLMVFMASVSSYGKAENEKQPHKNQLEILMDAIQDQAAATGRLDLKANPGPFVAVKASFSALSSFIPSSLASPNNQETKENTFISYTYVKKENGLYRFCYTPLSSYCETAQDYEKLYNSIQSEDRTEVLNQMSLIASSQEIREKLLQTILNRSKQISDKDPLLISTTLELGMFSTKESSYFLSALFKTSTGVSTSKQSRCIAQIVHQYIDVPTVAGAVGLISSPSLEIRGIVCGPTLN